MGDRMKYMLFGVEDRSFERLLGPMATMVSTEVERERGNMVALSGTLHEIAERLGYELVELPTEER